MTYHVFQTAPGGFEALEEGVVEDRSHLAAHLFVEFGQQFLLLRILAGDQVRGDQILDVGQERITGARLLRRCGVFGFVGDLIEQAAGDDIARRAGFGTGLGDEAAEDFIRRLFQRLRVFQALAHGAESGEEIAFLIDTICVEVLEFGEGQTQFGAVVTGERQAEINAQAGGEIIYFIPIDEEGATAEDRLDDATAGASGKIAHNENLEWRVRLRGCIDPSFPRLYIQHYARIVIFWHLLFPFRLLRHSRSPILPVSLLVEASNDNTVPEFRID